MRLCLRRLGMLEMTLRDAILEQLQLHGRQLDD